jgi:hypothetical protein
MLDAIDRFTAQRNEAIKKALRKARETGVAWAVITQDDGADGRAVLAVDSRYTGTDEFEAFDSRVLDVCHPNGRVD